MMGLDPFHRRVSLFSVNVTQLSSYPFFPAILNLISSSLSFFSVFLSYSLSFFSLFPYFYSLSVSSLLLFQYFLAFFISLPLSPPLSIYSSCVASSFVLLLWQQSCWGSLSPFSDSLPFPSLLVFLLRVLLAYSICIIRLLFSNFLSPLIMCFANEFPCISI